MTVSETHAQEAVERLLDDLQEPGLSHIARLCGAWAMLNAERPDQCEAQVKFWTEVIEDACRATALEVLGGGP